MMRLCMLIGIEAKVAHGQLAPCWTCDDAARDEEDEEEDGKDEDEQDIDDPHHCNNLCLLLKCAVL